MEKNDTSTVSDQVLVEGYDSSSPPRLHNLLSLISSGVHMDPYYQPKYVREGDCAKIKDVAKFTSEKESRVLVLYTGGTIGMKNTNGGKQHLT